MPAQHTQQGTDPLTPRLQELTQGRRRIDGQALLAGSRYFALDERAQDHIDVMAYQGRIQSAGAQRGGELSLAGGGQGSVDGHRDSPASLLWAVPRAWCRHWCHWFRSGAVPRSAASRRPSIRGRCAGLRHLGRPVLCHCRRSPQVGFAGLAGATTPLTRTCPSHPATETAPHVPWEAREAHGSLTRHCTPMPRAPHPCLAPPPKPSVTPTCQGWGPAPPPPGYRRNSLTCRNVASIVWISRAGT